MEKDKSNKVLFQKYEIVGQLGQGAEGHVYLARDLHLDRLAAVKEHVESKDKELENLEGSLEGSFIEEQAEDIQIKGEAKLLKELTHPGLPRIYDYFREDGRTYLVMEYVEGITLKKYLNKNKTVPIQQAVQWAVLLCDVLAYLHGRGQAVIYRDLKPENIMIQPDGRLKLIDLGGAMRYACGLEGKGYLAGTPGYCPSEQWKEKKGDKTWDVYALCAVLHELLTGISPRKQPYVRLPVRQYDRSIPRGLERVIEIGTSERKEDRYQTMEQLKEALLSYNKIGWSPKIVWHMKKTVVGLLFLASVLTLFIPLYKGVEESSIPFPLLNGPLILMTLAMAFNRIWFGRRKEQNYIRRQEKNIWLTEKKFSGLYVILFFLLGGILGSINETAYAGENEEKLWVEMRDDLGRKMLLRDGAVYVPEECVRFEIPADRLPDEKIRLQMVAEGDDGGVYVSRVFLIERKE